MKNNHLIFFVFALLFISACTGSKKYFKAAEKLEKQGLIGDAAEYYLVSLQRKPSNVDARVKLKSVGQKYISILSSDFFRNINTQQIEPSLTSYEKLKDFSSKTSALNVVLDYPKSYEEDYQKMVEVYCSKNYTLAHSLVNQKKYTDASIYITNIKKYNSTYKSTEQLEIIAYCEPFYQSAIIELENKNYNGAFIQLSQIKSKTSNYKDFLDLYNLAYAKLFKSIILIQPDLSSDKSEMETEEFLFNNFTQKTTEKIPSIQIINNTPFNKNTRSFNILNYNSNIDMLQAIQKATGADYIYAFEIKNITTEDKGPAKTYSTAYQEVKIKKNDTLTITEYKPLDYYTVKGFRKYTFEYNYKIINAYSNQILASETKIFKTEDAIEYNEFETRFTGNINTVYPYNPKQNPNSKKTNPKKWRDLFSEKKTILKSVDDLKQENNNKPIDFFINSVNDLTK